MESATRFVSIKENDENYTSIFIFPVLSTTARVVNELIPVVGQAIQLGCEVEILGRQKEITSYVWIHDNRELHDSEKYAGSTTGLLEIKVSKESNLRRN